MENSEIREKLSAIFSRIFNYNNAISDTLNADNVQKWDSLTHLSMISEVENTFGIKFKLKELVSMKNVGDLIELVATKTST